jgi:hypothetical protein
MANIVRSNVNIYASNEAINWLEQIINTIRQSENSTTALYEIFRLNELETHIDALSAKWVTIEDWMKYDDNHYYIALDSAWIFPTNLIERIVEKLQTLSENSEFENLSKEKHSMAKGRYYDETMDPIGVFESYSINDTEFIESKIDLDKLNQAEWEEKNPDGYFWDEIIEPIFIKLEYQLENRDSIDKN